MRPTLLLAAAILALPAAAQDWPAKPDRKPLSSRAQKLTAPGYYVKGDDLDVMAKELAACQTPPANPDYCATVILKLARGYEASDRPMIAAAVNTTLARFPVDPFPLLTLRSTPAGDRAAGLDALALAQDKTGSESEFACRNIRVQLALSIARWRMGGIAVPPSRDDAIRHCGPDSAEVPAAANATAVIFGTRFGTSPDLLQAATYAHTDALRIFGPDDSRTAIAAANRGALMLKSGSHAAAEPLLRAAYTRLEALGDRPATLAALVPLAELLVELNRSDEARVLIAGQAARDPAVGGPALHIRVLTTRARLAASHDDALKLIDEAIALARAAAAEKPDPVLIAFQRKQVESLGTAFSGMDMFQRSIDEERKELERTANARLAETLVARAERAFVAGKPAITRDSAREAKALDGSLYRAPLFEGLASLALGEIGPAESLFRSAATAQLPPNHPDRILMAMGLTYYMLGWSPTYAPCYARKATQMALARLDTDRADSNDNTAQFRSYAPLFRLRVVASWASAQGQARSSLTTPRECPGGSM
ncbi:hypothetical protein [Sphingomonas sp. LT1P40]|uniref:hypothetical protein n=1 Tax=Alteristakelama amylovorans TaxID=3096166 RepID=UPI002FCBFABE